MVHQQVVHLLEAFTGLLTGFLEVSSLAHQRLADPVKHLLMVFLQEGQQLLLDHLTHSPGPQSVVVGFCEGASPQLLDEQSLDFGAAEETFKRVDGAVGQGALHLHGFFGELELPLQVSPLPALLLKHGQHHLGEGVDGDLVNPFGQALAPVLPMALQGRLHGLPLDRMATVMAVADAVRTFDRGEAHGKHGGVFLT